MMNESFRSQLSKPSQSRQSQPTASVIQINRSMRTASKQLILEEHGGAIEEQHELRAEDDSRETSKQLALISEGQSELPFDKLLDEIHLKSPVTLS